MKWVCTICFLLISALSYSAEKESLYSQFEKLYKDFGENDERTLPVIALSIVQAKKLRDYKHLLYAYEDGLYHSARPSDKLKYADSIILTAIKLKNNDLIGRSYLGKGIVYYFNFKNYSAALAEYLEAHKYAQRSSDDYLKYKIKYHLGVVKNYLGYYEEASVHFRGCSSFFERNLKNHVNYNSDFNNTRGLLNSIHQLAVSEIYLNRYDVADNLVRKGFKVIRNRKEYAQEMGYFYKCYGILKFQKGNYREAETLLLKAVSMLQNKNDFASIAVAHYYLGKLQIKLGYKKQAVAYFKKVDSSFRVHHFMLPEIRFSYDYQIRYAKEQNDKPAELYNMSQMLKVDRILASDYPYLSSRVHREYDTANLIIDNKTLEKSDKLKTGLLAAGAVVSLAAISLLVYRNRRHKKVNKNYVKLLENMRREKSVTSNEPELIPKRKNVYNKEIVDEILTKLAAFEQGTKYLDNGLTMRKLAVILKTNGTHLSFVINDYKKMNFNTYIKTLRIKYITKQMYNNPVFLKYTVESLAKECGISSRQVFSDQFYEINGIRPTDFIRKRLKELQDSREV